MRLRKRLTRLLNRRFRFWRRPTTPTYAPLLQHPASLESEEPPNSANDNTDNTATEDDGNADNTATDEEDADVEEQPQPEPRPRRRPEHRPTQGPEIETRHIQSDELRPRETIQIHVDLPGHMRREVAVGLLMMIADEERSHRR